MQQSSQPPVETDAAIEVPTQCPPSHRAARKASVAIIAVLCLVIVAAFIYMLTTSG